MDFTSMTKAQIAAWAADLGAEISTKLTKDEMVVAAERLARQGHPAAPSDGDPKDRNAKPMAAPVLAAAPAPVTDAAPPKRADTVSVRVTAYHISSGPTLPVAGGSRRFPIGEWCHDVPRAALSALREAGIPFETEEH